MAANYQVPYEKLKALILSKGLAWQNVDLGDRYQVFAVEAGIQYESVIYKAPITVGGLDAEVELANQTDFENNYKTTSNQRLEQIDSDGAIMSRQKVAPSGWSFQLHGIEMETSVVGSVINNDYLERPIGDSIVTLYNADGEVITEQSAADTDCVRTVMDFEPPYDYYVVGGAIKLIAEADRDIRVYVVGAPDVPAQLGGSKIFIQHVNLRFTRGEGIHADGRAAKFVAYNPAYHTNKLRFLFTHAAGYKIKLALFLEFFKA